MIQLNRNEQAFDFPTELKALALERLNKAAWNRYPIPFQDKLIAKIGRFYKVNPESILLGHGSSGIIANILSIFRNQFDSIVIQRPSYEFFDMCVERYAFNGVYWDPDENMNWDYDTFPELAKSLYIICTPNNPTGKPVKKAFVEEKIKQLPESLFIIDEAYGEFSEESFVDLAERYPNVIVLRTFSKAWGLAGIRLGFAICSEAVKAEIMKFEIPFRINHFAAIIAEIAIEHYEDVVVHNVQVLRLEKERLYNFLQYKLDKSIVTIFPSDANFVLMRLHQSEKMEELKKACEKYGILFRGVRGFDDLIRVTVGTSGENDTVMLLLQKLLGYDRPDNIVKIDNSKRKVKAV